VYWYIGHYLEKVGKLALETKSVEEVFGSPEETEPGESNESSVDDEGFEGNTEEDSAVMSPESIRDASGGLGDLPVVVEPVIRELNGPASIEKARVHAVSSMLAVGMAGVSVVCQIATVGFFLHRAVVTSLVEMFLSFAVLAAFLATLMALASFF
jgi:hypothetical protein